MSSKKRKPAKLPVATQVPELKVATEIRVEHIADLMRAIQFQTGVTIVELAKKWSLSEQRVRELSAIASKRVRAELTDPDRVVVKVAAALEKVIDDALRETDEPALIAKSAHKGGTVTYQESPNGARKVLIEAAKTLCILTGNAAPTRVKVGTDAPADMSVEERREALARLKQDIAEEERRLDEAGRTIQ